MLGTDLLTETNARTGVEWEEDEGLRCEIGVQAMVEEAARIEFVGCP